MPKLEIPSLNHIIDQLPSGTPDEVIQSIVTAEALSSSIHKEARRPSGESFVEHARSVAFKLAELGIDRDSILAGLVHDTVANHSQKSEKARAKIRQQLGPQVENLVVSHTKLFPFSVLDGTEDEVKLEKLRRAILNSIDNDIRVLLLRMADNLTDLEWAKSLEEEVRLSIAREANEIYAPIANRLGIWYFKWRLEDHSFRYLQPEIYKALAKQLAEKRLERDKRVAKRKKELLKRLANAGIRGVVKGRSKHIASIHRKMQRKNVSFDEIYDLHALRVILTENDIGQCYQALGLVHNMWAPIPEEFDDYIAVPKPNGYRSLHTAVYDQEGHIIEIQIRTKEMDDDAERGIAAHWEYKEGARPSGELKKRVRWLRQLLIDLRDEEPEDAPADVRMINIDDLSKRIYVFTPNNDLVELPEGGTPIDFAYRIHTEVGHRCKGAIVNNKMVPLGYLLQPGDKVEIITAKRGSPSRDWMSESSGYARSARTRSRVRQWFREHDRAANIEQGQELIERELRRLKFGSAISMPELAAFFDEESAEDFLAKVGFGDIVFNQVTGAIGLLLEEKRTKARKRQKEKEAEAKLHVDGQPLTPQAPTPGLRKSRKGILIEGIDGLSHRMANCCMPIPPEPIKGYVTRGQGVTVHRSDCRQFSRIALNEPERVIAVSWGNTQAADSYEIPLVVKAYRRPELAEDIAKMISGRQIDLVGSKSETDTKGITTLSMTIRVLQVTDLDWLTNKLHTMPTVLDVQRQRWVK